MYNYKLKKCERCGKEIKAIGQRKYCIECRKEVDDEIYRGKYEKKVLHNNKQRG